MPEVHARLGASSAHRWLNCPGSMGLCRGIEQTTSIYAKEGTLAHSICELYGRHTYHGLPDTEGFQEAMAKYMADPLYDPEMLDCAQEYLKVLEEIVTAHRDPDILFEERLDYSAYVPDGFGTGDCVVISPSRIDVLDYKHGKGIRVDVKNNPQLMLYGVGAICERTRQGQILPDVVGLHICQPRNSGNSSWIISTDELLDWARTYVESRAAKANDCYYKPPESISEEDLCAGEWCRFCGIKATCRKRGDSVALEVFGKRPSPEYSDEELSDILERVDGYKKWAEDVSKYCLARALKGDPIPGWKAVNGKGKRTFIDPETAVASLTLLGYDKEVFYEQKPKSLTAIEAQVGKPAFKSLEGVIYESRPGKPTLAKADDRRPAVTSAELVFADRDN